VEDREVRITRYAILLGAVVLVVYGGLLVAQTPPATAKYIGFDNCKCHPDIITDWQKTPHAGSYDLLVNAGQEKSAACLACHSTGYGKGGFVDEATTPGLKMVTCEACHGPGSEHASTMDKTKINRIFPATVCAACHQEINIHSIKK